MLSNKENNVRRSAKKACCLLRRKCDGFTVPSDGALLHERLYTLIGTSMSLSPKTNSRPLKPSDWTAITLYTTTGAAPDHVYSVGGADFSYTIELRDHWALWIRVAARSD